MKHQKISVELSVFIILLFLIADILISYAEQPSVSLKTYSIKPIPFTGYETVSDITGTPIIFSEHDKMLKVIYPVPKDAIVQDPESMLFLVETPSSPNFLAL